MSQLPKLLSAKDIKEYLHIGNDKAYALLKSKSFPSLKIGNRYYVIEDDFVVWLSQQTKKIRYK